MAAHCGETLRADLTTLGVRSGDTVMVHASLKAIGPVEGGPATVVQALLDAIGPRGNLMAFVSWDRSPYEETLNGRRMSPADRAAWPAFDPATAGVFRPFGMLNAFIVAHPGAARSGHPDASMAAIGPDATWLTADHRLGQAYGPGSPLERFVAMGGRTLLLGAPLDAVTVLHYAEAVADISGKRRIAHEMPLIGPDGRKLWAASEDFDSNGILDIYAQEGSPDAVERIARDYVAEGRGLRGRVGDASCHLFDARDIVSYGRRWLETRHASGAP